MRGIVDAKVLVISVVLFSSQGLFLRYLRQTPQTLEYLARNALNGVVLKVPAVTLPTYCTLRI